MKLLSLAALAAISIYAQSAKVEPAKDKPVYRVLSETEVLKTRLAARTIKDAQKEHDIPGFQKEIAEPQQTYSQVLIDACESVGVAADKIQTECEFTNGYDADDKPILGPDGKTPVEAHARKAIPAPPVQTSTPPKK